MKAQAHAEPIYQDAGDSGLIVEFGTGFSKTINNAVIAFDRAVQSLDFPGMVESAPTIKSVLIRYDPLLVSPNALRSRVEELVRSRNWLTEAPPAGRTLWRIPALYGKKAGPDLPELSDLMGISEETAIESHAQTRQRVYMIGFAPGQAYLGILDPQWNIPRLPKVNPSVPAGSLLIAVRQTALYAVSNPTGWRVIARTPFRGFLPNSAHPFKLSAGDEVIFEPISESDYARLEQLVLNGTPIAVSEELP